MKQILFVLFIIGMLLYACSSVKKANLSLVTQGITGSVTLISGNQMPMKGRVPDLPKGIKATILIYEPTQLSQVQRVGTSPLYTAITTKRVALVETDSSGNFTISLPAGKYSVFILQGAVFYANLFDTENNIALFTVEANKLTNIRLSVNSAASY
jgi:hypothetical protein